MCVPSGKEGDGLGDLSRAAKSALMGFAKRAGKSVLSACATVLKDVIEGENAGESSKNAFSDVGMSLLDNTVSCVRGRKRKAPGTRSGQAKNRNELAIYSADMYNFSHSLPIITVIIDTATWKVLRGEHTKGDTTKR